jgi:hypothetical protein
LLNSLWVSTELRNPGVRRFFSWIGYISVEL